MDIHPHILQPSFVKCHKYSCSLPSGYLHLEIHYKGPCKVSQARFLVNHMSFKERNCITVKAATGTPQRALSVNHLFSSRDARIPKHSYLTQTSYCRAVGIFPKCKLLHSVLLNTVNTSLGPFCLTGYMHLHNL